MIEFPPVRIQKEDTAYFNQVDDIIGRAVAAGDPMIALEFVQGVQREGFIKGLAIAKLLYRMKQSWQLFQVAGIDDTFENVIEGTIGYSPATVNKYVRMWESIFENNAIADELKQVLMGKPIETLLLLTAAARDGSLDDDDWEDIAHTSDIKEVRSKIREKRGEKTSSRNARLLSLYFRDTGSKTRGTLIVTVGGEQKVVGYLNMDDPDEDVQKSIEKIINTLRVYEVY